MIVIFLNWQIKVVSITFLKHRPVGTTPKLHMLDKYNKFTLASGVGNSKNVHEISLYL